MENSCVLSAARRIIPGAGRFHDVIGRDRCVFKSVRRYAGRVLGAFFALSLLQVAAVRYINPPGTPLMVYRWARGDHIDCRWRPLREISPFLQQAVLAAEDQCFTSHRGFDFEQIKRSLEERVRRDRHRGASTITMQTARNLYLWQGYSWSRKAFEVYYTLLIELLWSKGRILEVYLNIAEWGPGLFGAEAAAQHYFKCRAQALTKSQAALMAAVLPSPRTWSPLRPTRFLHERKTFILKHMDRFRAFPCS